MGKPLPRNEGCLLSRCQTAVSAGSDAATLFPRGPVAAVCAHEVHGLIVLAVVGLNLGCSKANVIEKHVGTAHHHAYAIDLGIGILGCLFGHPRCMTCGWPPLCSRHPLDEGMC